MTKKKEEMASSESNHITDLTRMMNSIDVPPPVYFCTVDEKKISVNIALEFRPTNDIDFTFKFRIDKGFNFLIV